MRRLSQTARIDPHEDEALSRREDRDGQQEDDETHGRTAMNLLRKLKAAYSKVLLAAALMLLSVTPALAGTTGGGSNPFGSLITMLIGWLQGGLGLLLSIVGVIVGLIAGVARGSIAGVLTGFGVAIAAYWSPSILQGIFGATVHFAPAFRTVAGF